MNFGTNDSHDCEFHYYVNSVTMNLFACVYHLSLSRKQAGSDMMQKYHLTEYQICNITCLQAHR